MKRYSPENGSRGVLIHDSVLNQYIMDGKESVLVCSSYQEAWDIITIMRQRVGA